MNLERCAVEFFHLSQHFRVFVTPAWSSVPVSKEGLFSAIGEEGLGLRELRVFEDCDVRWSQGTA